MCYLLDNYLVKWCTQHMKERWTTSRTAVYNIAYHLIWCPKYRRRVLTGEVERRLADLLHRKAEELEITIETMEIMPDHVHLFVKSSPVNSPHYIVQQLKGSTSRILRQEFPSLKLGEGSSRHGVSVGQGAG